MYVSTFGRMRTYPKIQEKQRAYVVINRRQLCTSESSNAKTGRVVLAELVATAAFANAIAA